MPALVPTLNSLLERAHQLFDEGRYSKALDAYENLVVRAQEKMDRSTEVIARSRIAECFVIRQDGDAALDQLQRAKDLLDQQNRTAHLRYRWAYARTVLLTETKEAARAELQDYVRWADDDAQFEALIDGCCLLAESSSGEERIQWLERALQVGQDTQTTARLGRICNDLAASFDGMGRTEEALDLYELALGWHRMMGSTRDQVGACWAIGSVALREEDFPLARTRLEEATALAGEQPECQDLLALALADLGRVHFEAGDVIEARRLVIQSLKHAREVDLSTAWNQAWSRLLSFAESLDIRP